MNLTSKDIEKAKTLNGGWTRKQLAVWGVKWPPPKGWKESLLMENKDGLQSVFEGQR